MKSVGVFDILGPVMVGPSSSHTAGAARLGKVARAVAGGDIEEVTFYLHGSFAKTYKGHGTDRALVAGILGMEPSDLRLRDSLDIAKEMGLKIHFKEADLGDVHPNTVEFVIKGEEGTYELIGSSIGGGSIEVTSVNRNTVNFTGAYPTIIVSNKDVPGVVPKVTSILYDNDINTKKLPKSTVVWVADYNESVSTSSPYHIWQYSRTGKSDSIESKYVDLNYWYSKKQKG